MMDLTNGHVLFSLFLVLSVAYLFHINFVLHEKLKTQSWYVKNIQRILDVHNVQIESQHDSLKITRREFEKKARSHDDILKFIDKELESLRSKVDRTETFLDIQKDKTETIGNILKELKDVTESLSESVERLEYSENKRSSSGIVSFIQQGISKIAQIIFNLFGSVTKRLK